MRCVGVKMLWSKCDSALKNAKEDALSRIHVSWGRRENFYRDNSPGVENA
jgi:hypothetical protein